MQNFIRVRRFSRRRTKLLQRVPPSLTHGGSRHALPILRPSGAPPFTRSSFVGRCASRRRRRGTTRGGTRPLCVVGREEAPLPPRSGRFFSFRTVVFRRCRCRRCIFHRRLFFSRPSRGEETRRTGWRLLGGRERGSFPRSDSRVWETAAAPARMGTCRRAISS